MPTETKAHIQGLQRQLEEKSALADGIASEWKVEDGGQLVVSTDSRNKYVKAVREAQEIKALLDAAQGQESIKQFMTQPAEFSTAGQHYSTPSGTEFKSLGDMFIESDAYKQAAASGFQDRPYIRAGMEGKSIFSMSAGTVTHQALGSVQQLGITEAARRKWHVRDLFPKATTKAAVLYGVRETGFENNAKQVKERYAADGTSPATGGDTDTWGRAPRSKLTVVPVMYPIGEIPHLLDAHKNLLSDEPRLKKFISDRMVEGVKFAEDWELLHSLGDGETITGLFNVSGVQQYTGLAADKESVQVRRAMTKALVAEYDPTGLVISPSMWEHIEVEEDNNGAFRVALQVAIGAEKRVWRVNVVETTAMPDGKFLLGAFGMGAQLYDREAVSVTVSSENGDNFEKGIVTFRADERVALEVPRPESFVVGTFTA